MLSRRLQSAKSSDSSSQLCRRRLLSDSRLLQRGFPARPASAATSLQAPASSQDSRCWQHHLNSRGSAQPGARLPCTCRAFQAGGAETLSFDDRPRRSFEDALDIPGQGEALTRGGRSQQVLDLPEQSTDVDYLSELIAVQQAGPREIGFFGTRNMGFSHQKLIEVLSYAMVLTDNHVFTSGATGTNAAVIRGALRAEKPHLLTVVLPQSLRCQPSESQELLQEVQQIEDMPQNDYLTLLEASRICNRKIVSYVKQVICFAFHDSRLLLETCEEAKQLRKMVTMFYLD